MNQTEQRICNKHGLTKFRNQSKTKNRWRCCKCGSEASQKRRETIKKLAVEYKGGRCQICGYNKCIAALDFHHVDGNKDYGISANGYSHSWEKIKTELDKCILVCSNCHREIHYLNDTKLYP